MKFHCKTPETRAQYVARLEQWHRWFAWHPVRVAKNDCRWLEVVERKAEQKNCWDDSWFEWEYREAK